ncbi:MAG TPA: hypothetical protein VLA10_05365 [Ilumatobacter sp.]|nr:hypothetical protein [Ilumatobacter sp.]
MLRPSVVIRRKAVRQGFLGNSTLWKVIGVVVFGKRTISRFFGRRPEVVDVSTLAPGRMMTISAIRPTSRRARRKAMRSGGAAVSLAGERAAATAWADSRARRAS